MNKFIDWNSLDFRKTSGKEKLRCPSCDDSRSNKKDKSLLINHDLGYGKCFYCESLSFKQVNKVITDNSYVTPNQDWFNYTNLSDGIIKYLEKRGITQKTAVSLGITEEIYYQPSVGANRNNIVFNYFEADVIVNKKYRTSDKLFTQSTNGKSIFYNINSIVNEEECYIVEGEFDVLAVHQVGIKNVISVPNGANDNDKYWLNSEKYLKNIKKFYIATDNDEKGNDLAEKIAQRLGRWRCERINFKGKDANDDLINSCLLSSLSNRTSYPVAGTHLVNDLIEDINNLYDNGFPETIYPKHSSFGNLKNVFSVMRGHLVVGTGIPSHGKALDINTLIPTPVGFKKMIDLRVGDSVFDEKGKECFVKWKSEVWSDRPTYKITFSDNSEIIADEKHEWLTDTWKSRRSKSNAIKNNRIDSNELKSKGTDQTLKRTFASIKTTKEISQTLKTKNDNRNNHSVLLAKAVDINKKNLLIDPYVLGCWLGDGTSAGGGFCSKDIEIIENIRNRGYDVNKQSALYGYGIIGIVPFLRELNLLKNKHIPKDYLFSSKEQRFELLRGLMDTDGHCSIVDSRNEFCGINYALVRGVYQLVCSLGIKATFVESDAVLNGKVISKKYRVFFKTNEKVFNLKRKQNVLDSYFKNRTVRGNDVRYIINCELVSGYKTQCIEVDSESHLFLAGEQFIPTHNSNFTEWYVLNLISDYKMKASFYSPEHHPFSLHHSTFIQKVYGKNFFKDFDGVPRVSKEEIEKYKEWANDKIYLTAPDNNVSPTWGWLLDRFKEQMICYGIDIFVIDAFNKLEFDKSSNRLEQINEVLTKLTTFAQMNNVIIFLVAHPTKMKKNESGTYESPTLYDVSGSSDFRNQTHDGYCIYRSFNEDGGYTTFTNLKTKMTFQGEIGAYSDFEYDLPSGRYYERGTKCPTHSLINNDSYQRTESKKIEYENEKHNMITASLSEAFDIDNDIPF